MLYFSIYRDGKKVKSLKAATMETIFRNFTKYCNEKGFSQCVYNASSFGNSAWVNVHGQVMTLQADN